MKQKMINVIRIALVAIWTSSGAYQALAQQPAQPAFTSAAEASQSLFQAVQSNNEQAIANILGGPTELTSSRDPGQDQQERGMFCQKYNEMHRLRREADRSVTLYIGAENWPFPIPIIEHNNVWRFDSDAGSKEIMFRRIGENELTAIMICHQFVAGEMAHRANSTATNPEDGSSAILVAKAVDESVGGNPVLFHGYYFRGLATGQTLGTRGVAMIAYPAEYRSSGVMTFLVTSNGDIVYEKDLGPNTTSDASAMTGIHKDATWRASNESNHGSKR